MSTEELSMSMFATRADYDAAVLVARVADLEAEVKRLSPTDDDIRYTAEQDWSGLPGSTAWLLIERHADGWGGIGAMMEAWRDAEVRRVTAGLEAERDKLKSDLSNALDTDLCARVGIEQEREITALTAERDELRAELERSKEAHAGTLERYSTAADQAGELRARLAEIEGQEPVRWVWEEPVGFGGCPLDVYSDARPQGEFFSEARPLYARPVPAIPDGWMLVPEEVTPEMEDAGRRWGACPLNTYLDMISAAPEAAR